MKQLQLFILCGLLLGSTTLKSQSDTLLTANGERFIGSVERLEKSVLTFSSESGKSSFRINWKKVVQINTNNPLRLINQEREVFEASLMDRVPGDDSLVAITKLGNILQLAYKDVLALRKLESGFKEKFDFNINMGYSFSKGNSTQQFSLRTGGGYLSSHWSIDGEYNRFITIIDTLQNGRLDASLNNRYLMEKNWFTLASFNWFSSDEQKLDLRTTVMLGGGNYILLDQSKSLQFSAGLAFNRENFTLETASRNESYELFISGRYHLFDHNVFGIESGFHAYYSLSGEERYRASYNLDFNWDIDKHFDLIWGYTLNYDSNTPNQAQNTDYVISLTLGWQL